MRNVRRDRIDAAGGLLFPFVVALLGFVVIAPSLRTGWYADDAYYWALPGWLALRHESLLAIMQHAFALWLFGNARFYPGLVVEKFWVFATFTDVLAYKWLLIVLTLVAVELFRRCVAVYASLGVANLAALVVCAILQERAYHDALLAYNGMPQVVAIAVLLSLLAFAGAGTGRRTVAFVLAVVAGLTYEEVYAFGLLYLALARTRTPSWAVALRRAAPFLALSALLMALGVALHLAFPPHGSYALSLAPVPLLVAAFDQVAAAFPLVYWAADPNGIFGRSSLDDFWRNAPVDPLLVAAFAVAAWVALRRLDDAARAGPLAAIGALVVLLLAAPVAILVKYQHELRLGLGYLPVFGEYFGAALILVAVCLAARGRFPRVAPVVGAVAIGLVAAMTQATNVRVVRELEPDAVAQRAFIQALRHGLVAGVAENATVATRTAEPWLEPDGTGPEGISVAGLFYAYAHARVRVVSVSVHPDVVLEYDPADARWRRR